tara:strand:- start:143 stop:700 length:558 start_codon:yes stop_codon:yes gene_type:complete
MAKNKRAAMELSIGTIVIIVLAMSMLVLGVILIRNIFGTATTAIDGVDAGVKSEIQKIFSNEGSKIAVYPTSRKITIKQGAKSEGFAFSIKNIGVDQKTFSYTLVADQAFNYQCGTGFTYQNAGAWISAGSGSFTLLGGTSLDLPELVLFNIPREAPPCTVKYNLEVKDSDNVIYSSASIFLEVL